MVLDPPYPTGHDLYAVKDNRVAAAVLAWCKEHWHNPLLRIALCGYEGEVDAPAHWRCLAWRQAAGYQSHAKGNAERERVWLSPACLAGEGASQAVLCPISTAAPAPSVSWPPPGTHIAPTSDEPAPIRLRDLSVVALYERSAGAPNVTRLLRDLRIIELYDKRMRGTPSREDIPPATALALLRADLAWLELDADSTHLA